MKSMRESKSGNSVTSRLRTLLRKNLGVALAVMWLLPVPCAGGDRDDPFEDLRQVVEQQELDDHDGAEAPVTTMRTLTRLQDAAPAGNAVDMPLVPPSATDISTPLDNLDSQLNQLSSSLQLGGPLNPHVTRSTDIYPLPAANKPPSYPNVRVTGFFQLDAGFFSQSDASIAQFGNVRNDMGFRRTRLAAVGDVSENVSYMLEMDFAFPGRPSFMDVFLDLHSVPLLGNVRIGQWRQPFGLDNLNSVRELTFLERPLMFAMSPFRETGIGFYNRNESETVTWAASVYGYPADAWGNTFGDKGLGTAERMTALLIDDDEGAHLLHVGFEHCFTVPGINGLAYRNTNEYGSPFGSFVAATFPGGAGGGGSVGDLPLFVNTGPLFFDHANLLNAEFAGVCNSFHWQSELTYSVLDFAGKTVVIPAFYAQAACVLTGEVRPYNKKAAVFGRIKPLNPWTPKGGIGAWEVAARYSYINMNPIVPFQPLPPVESQPGGPPIAWGGAMNNYSAVLNWYLNGYTKFQLEYIYSDMNRGGHQSTMNTICTRAQLDF